MNYLKPEDSWYPAWRAWRQLGKPTALRPKNAPKIIPIRAWQQMREDDRVLRAEVAEAARQWRFKFWDVPAYAVAWTQREPQKVCSDIANWGGKAVWVQSNPAQRAKAASWRRAATMEGLALVVWEWPTAVSLSIDSMRLFGADAHLSNVEHETPGGWRPYAEGLRKAFPDKPLGVWTTFWGVGADNSHPAYSRELAKPWVDNDFVCVTEAYLVNEHGPQPTLNPLNLDHIARERLGFEKSIPSFGVYRTGPETYREFIAPNGPFKGYGWYLYETMPGGA